MNILLVGTLTMLTIGGGAAFAAFQYWESDPPPDDACQSLPPTPAEGGDGLIRFELDNDGPAQTVFVCAVTHQHDKVAVREVRVPARARSTVDLQVPAGAYYAQVELDRDGPVRASATANPYLLLCSHKAERIPFTVSSGGLGVNGGGCFDPGSTGEQRFLGLMAAQVVDGPPVNRAIAAGVGATALTGLAILGRARLHFALLLFTRLARPRVLDRQARAQIHELVNAQPGIHGNAIAKTLDLARGEALYHLRVLVREQALVRLQNWGQRSFFVAGRYPPQQMRAMAALRSGALDRLYTAVRTRPGATLAEVAHAAGYSLGRASRLARRLEEAGLVERSVRGRAVVLSPRAGLELPSLVAPPAWRMPA